MRLLLPAHRTHLLQPRVCGLWSVVRAVVCGLKPGPAQRPDRATNTIYIIEDGTVDISLTNPAAGGESTPCTTHP